MPDPNTPPGQLLNENPFGQIVRIHDREESRYQITPLDYLFMAVASRYEEEDNPHLVIWSQIQRWGGAYGEWPINGSAPRPGRWSRIIETYCAPINPSFSSNPPYTPEQATRGCNCADLYPRQDVAYKRDHAPWTGVGRGTLPGPHATGIPGAPNQSTWNIIQCSRGTRPGAHGGDNKRAKRQTRWANMRLAMGFGTSNPEEQRRAWLLETIPASREKAWGIFTGQMGNPIPGFDNFAHYLDSWRSYTYSIQGVGRQQATFILPEMTGAEREDTINRLASERQIAWRAEDRRLGPNRNPGANIRYIFTAPRADGTYAGKANSFYYRSYLRGDDTVHIECNVGGVNRNSDNAPIDYSHYGDGASSVRVVGSNTATGGSYSAPAGGTVPTTNQGLAPTEQRPASSGSSSTRIQSELPDRATLFGQLNAWADTVEVTLSQNLGRGLRR